MVGITSYGGYIPRMRLNRGAVYAANAWMAPGLIGSAGGERSMANWDEDSLTMAVESARDCISGTDKSKIDAAYLVSLNLPFEDRLNSGILASAMSLNESIETADFTASMRSGLSAVIAGMNAVKSGDYRNVLVAAGDRRITKMACLHELQAGDGAASLLLGSDNVIAEYKGSFTVSEDFVDHFRGKNQKFDYSWEERWVREEGVLGIVPKAVKGLLEKTGMAGSDITRFVMPCVFGRVTKKIAGGLGINPDNVAGNMHEVCGDTGTAHPLVMLVSALEEAKAGDKILVASFGNGCCALLFDVTDNISSVNGKRGIKGSLADRKEEMNYMKFLSHRGMLEQDLTMRAEGNYRTALTTLYRHRNMILGLVGGRCTTCGTCQFPKAEVCVNPECVAVKSQEDLEFADVPAEIMSYTSDLLTYSPDPPVHYGMVVFENDARGFFDFTDYETGKIEVGLPVRMVFRIKNVDKARGFNQYYWKAKPIIEVKEAQNG